MGDIIGAKVVTTRKSHICFGCGREIPKGSRMEKSLVIDGTPFSCYLCETCLAISKKFFGNKGNYMNNFKKWIG